MHQISYVLISNTNVVIVHSSAIFIIEQLAQLRQMPSQCGKVALISRYIWSMRDRILLSTSQWLVAFPKSSSISFMIQQMSSSYFEYYPDQMLRVLDQPAEVKYLLSLLKLSSQGDFDVQPKWSYGYFVASNCQCFVNIIVSICSCNIHSSLVTHENNDKRICIRCWCFDTLRHYTTIGLDHSIWLLMIHVLIL